jgi:prepilin signal peptidase PulO-like enzyme (type II secretory pathway)
VEQCRPEPSHPCLPFSRYGPPSEHHLHANSHGPSMIVVLAVFVGLLGGAIGSFAGVVASRGLRDSLGGRSHCDSCGRSLSWYELVPIISYPALCGRCRTCHARVGIGVYAWEMGGALLALALALPLALAVGITTP